LTTSRHRTLKADAQGSSPLSVGIDLRCLEAGAPRGLARYTLEISQALAKREHVNIVGLSRQRIPFDLPYPVQIINTRSELITEQIAFPIASQRLGLDVLLCPANRGLPLMSPCPSVLTLHDTAEWDRDIVPPSSGRSSIRINYASILSLASAARIITVSQASALSIASRLSVGPQRIRVIPEAAASRFTERKPGAIQRVLRSHGLGPGYILYVGGFDPKKDVPTLLRARSMLSGIEPPLVLVGRLGDEGARMADLAERLGIGSLVHFLGFVDDDDLADIYQGASCLAFPAIAEGFGLPVIEAMAAGIPVVAADAGSLPELVADGGQLFPPGHVSALAAILKRLVTDPVEADKWRIAATSQSEHFSWELAASSTEQVLREASTLSTRSTWTSRAVELHLWRSRLLPRA
jgi:glycosyltransferase involved in cell wall biosynthesis